MLSKIFSTALPFALFLTAGAATQLVGSSTAEAQRIRGRVFIVQKKLPRKTTAKGLVRFGRANHRKVLQEVKSGPVEDRYWPAELIVSFNRPPNDREFEVAFYDIEDGVPRFLRSMTTFINNPRETTFVQKVKLPRKKFKENRRYELVVRVKRQEAARVKFGLAGERKRNSGVVDFSEDE